MPLHDWTDGRGWAAVHAFWVVHLARHLRPILPTGFRALVGTMPTLAVEVPAQPDVGVVGTPQPPPADPADRADPFQPEFEAAVVPPDPPPPPAVLVSDRGRLLAAIELVSPRNKDRRSARLSYGAKYEGYLIQGVNLLLVDTLPRPYGFSFVDHLAAELQLPDHGPMPPPAAASYRIDVRVGGPPLLSVRRARLAVGEPLPTMPLALTPTDTVPVDLESTYRLAAEDAYLT